MRNFYILLLTISSIIGITSCEEEDKFKITVSEITLYNKDTYQIEATSDNPITYTSEDEFHATVSQTGLVTAAFVGTTNIIVESGGETKLITVTVSPKQTIFYEPFIEWGTTKTAIRLKFGNNGYENTEINYIDYDGLNASDVVGTRFIFDDNNRLSSTAIYLYSEDFDKAALALHERYQFLESEETEDGGLMHFFIDALNPDDAQMYIAILEVNDGLLAVAYMPSNSTTTNRSTPLKKNLLMSNGFNKYK